MQPAELFSYVEPHRFPPSEFERLFEGQRVELIEGLVVDMAPSGPAHDGLIDRLSDFFFPALTGRARIRIQSTFSVGKNRLAPDVAIVPLGSYMAAHPERAHLIIEISETTLRYDREGKRALYVAGNVDEYWVVNVADRSVEVIDLRTGGVVAYRTGRLSPSVFPDLAIDIEWLFEG
jgi:Uma2 family endonuclease